MIRKIYDTHQTGYGTEVAEKLVLSGLQQQKLPVIVTPQATPVFREQALGVTPLDCLLINNRLILVSTALFDDNAFNISRGLSFMKSLNIPWGIAVNFGKKHAQVNGLSLSQDIRGTAMPPAEK
jgi:hypothetical protein